MNEERIRQDEQLAKITIRGLTSYAEQIVRQEKDEEVQQIRDLVDALSGYWGVDGKRDWTGEFDEKVQQVRQKGHIPWRHSNISRIKVVEGLYRYAEEMALAQGVEEIERILEIPDVIRRIGKAWRICQSDIETACQRIEDIAGLLQAPQQDTGMQISMSET